ncbi:V-type ATP synthase subunit D [Thermoproteota archaeon]
MPKIKLTKGELKRQRDATRQYERYLPTLQLKKQQLQIEIIRQTAIIDGKKTQEESKLKTAQGWAGLLCDKTVELSRLLIAKQVVTDIKNIAGVKLPLFVRVEFEIADYDLFVTPLWVDGAIEAVKELISLRKEIATLEEGISILKRELRITSQRVNLFEKVKIPEAKEAIRVIKIYLGDQMTNAVGRSKIAKRKIEAVLAGAMS